MRGALLCTVAVVALGGCFGGVPPASGGNTAPAVDAGTTLPAVDAGNPPTDAGGGNDAIPPGGTDSGISGNNDAGSPGGGETGTRGSSDAGSGGTDTGGNGSTDAGTPGGTDGGTNGGTDTGSNGSTDAGTPGGTDGGTSSDTDAGSPGTDAGSPGDTGGGTDGGSAATFPASEDPQFVVIRSSAPACSGIGPQGDPGTPTRVLRAFPSGYWWCRDPAAGDFATSDGQGDVAFSCESALPESGWNEVYSRDGTVNTKINSWGLVAGLGDGFVAAYIPWGNFKADLTFTWFDGTWHSAGYSDKPEEARGAAALAWRPVLVVRRSDRTTQWHDEHGNPLRPAVTWPYIPLVLGVDTLGHALIGQNTPGTAEGEIYGMWIDSEDQQVGLPFSWRDFPGGRAEPVIGGGLLFNRTTFVPSGGAPHPAPAWFATHAEPMRIVNDARAYAFARSERGSCAPTVTLVAPDGTECGSISLIGRDFGCPQTAAVGVDGSLIQSIATDVKDPSGYAYTIWRWWPAYLLR